MIRSQKVHIIWTSDIDEADWVKELSKEYPGASDYDLHMIAQEINDGTLEDERENLDIQLPEEIIGIGTLGLWSGRARDCVRYKSGNIKDLLYSDCIDNKWYCDRYNFRFEGRHHDGANHYVYRVFREGLSDFQKQHFIDELMYDGKMDSKYINRYTKSIRPYIAKRYGWAH